MLNANPNAGVKERIKSAESPKEISKLLALIASYAHAHPSTFRKCERAAARRLRELELSSQKQPTKKDKKP